MSTLCKGLSINNRYVLKEFIGQGGFGEVWLAEDDSRGRDVAIKFYVMLSPDGIEELKSEFYNTAGLTHPNLLVPENLEIWENRAYMVMEYCQAGSASNMVGLIDQSRMWEFIRDIANGLAFLHSLPAPIIHQDIKPDNILVAPDGRFVITDFGISRKLRNTMSHLNEKMRMGGAVSYMAPERFGDTPEVIKASDIWSLGASIYEMGTGRLPFDGLGGGIQRNGAEIPHLPPSWPQALDDLVMACLDIESWRRPTAEEVANYASAYIRGDRSPEQTWLARGVAGATAATAAATATAAAPASMPASSAPVEEAVTPPVFESFADTTEPVQKAARSTRKYIKILAAAAVALVLVDLGFLLFKKSADTGADADKGQDDLVAKVDEPSEVEQNLLIGDYDEEEMPDIPTSEPVETAPANDNPAVASQPVASQPMATPEMPKTKAPEATPKPTVRPTGDASANQRSQAPSTRYASALGDETYTPIKSNYVKNSQATVNARRLDGSMPEGDYYEKNPKYVIDYSQTTYKREPAEVHYPVDNAAAMNQAARSGDYNKLLSLVNSGYSQALVPLANLCLRSGRYSEADSYARQAKSAGIAGADAVINYLKSSGYYD